MSKDELWRQSPSLPEYMVSSLGRIMRVPYMAPLPNGGMRHYGGEPWYGSWAKDLGRYIFQFHGHSYKVHRLVCEAFHGRPPFDDAVVMHLDEDASNNREENLQWGSQKENLNAPGFIEYCRSRTGDDSPTTKGRRNKPLLAA